MQRIRRVKCLQGMLGDVVFVCLTGSDAELVVSGPECSSLLFSAQTETTDQRFLNLRKVLIGPGQRPLQPAEVQSFPQGHFGRGRSLWLVIRY